MFVIFLLILTLSEPHAVDSTVYITHSGTAEFTSSVPLHTFTGKSDHLIGMIDFEENLIDFYLDLNTIRTGIDRRDRDFFRTLKVDQYPFAEFTGSFETVPEQSLNEEIPVKVTGDFTIHGVTKQIQVDGIIKKTENGLHLEAGWILLLADYEIEPPGILFYRVNEEQNIQIKAMLSAQPKE